eukprot:3466758-Pyramimonas_sp.AAC.2
MNGARTVSSCRHRLRVCPFPRAVLAQLTPDEPSHVSSSCAVEGAVAGASTGQTLTREACHHAHGQPRTAALT